MCVCEELGRRVLTVALLATEKCHDCLSPEEWANKLRCCHSMGCYLAHEMNKLDLRVSTNVKTKHVAA